MILGFKGFKPGLVATLGNGKFQYVPNELNETKKAMCASTGFHYCLDPWDCLNWYTWNGKNEFWAVAAGGDVDEDGYGSRSSCTKLVPLRKLTAEEFLLMPENNDEHRNVQQEELTTCLTDEQLSKYLGIHPGWGWHISNLKIYDRPLDLREITGLQETRFGMRPVEITSPPQSWRYVEDAECTS